MKKLVKFDKVGTKKKTKINFSLDNDHGNLFRVHGQFWFFSKDTQLHNLDFDSKDNNAYMLKIFDT